MAIKKKKISELTLSDNLKGLYTIGVKLINGVQTSVKVSLEYIQTAYENAVKATNSANEAAKSANNAASSANTAKDNANEATGDARVVIARLEELEESLISKYKLIPTSMKLNYPKKVTYRNTQPFKVEVELLPVDTGRNVLFLGDDRAVSITPDGVFMINGVGMSKIHVIPTENTGIYQTIQIEVQEPGIRFTSGKGMRLSGSGGIILT